ncbi:UV radiation resistance-associated gene protein-like [Paramacrobiotus metropolitanus]|uniref:UV radiation resistance-associated gene protein-like n=1 Tax=Paramacrobiotus metropolitanus TaxID=2943436 RepID=UPI0024456275|nr:UV radiation resistance-associated gene protein-like [Paramacrobiotus metropolitanus]
MESTFPDPFSPQKRLRNLRGISRSPFGRAAVRVSGPCLRSCLHSTHSFRVSPPVFISEPIYNSANPTWEEMDTTMFADARSTECVVQLFLLHNGDYSPYKKLCYWQLDFRLLVRIGDAVDSMDYDFNPNTVIFALKCGVYVLPDSIPKNFREIPPAPSRTVRRACPVGTLRQLLKLENDYSAIQIRKRDSYALVQESTNDSAQSQMLNRQIELFTQRVVHLKSLLRERRQENCNLSLSVSDLTSLNERVSDTLETSVLDLILHKRNLTTAREELLRSKTECSVLRAGLRSRRCELVSDLKLIYPIHRSPSGRVFVSGIWLPSVDDYVNCDDTTLSASLGYAAHLLVLLSRILNVPLRYPLKFYCSTSSVTNPASARIYDRDREYPLHLKVRDRNRFYEGVYLLNCDVIQLRLNFGLGTREVKNTIENIQSLMVERFEVQPPRTPSIRIPPSPLPQDNSAHSSPFTPMVVSNGLASNGHGEQDESVPPVTPAIIFPVQSAPDLGRLKVPSKPENPFFIQNRQSRDASDP